MDLGYIDLVLLEHEEVETLDIDNPENTDMRHASWAAMEDDFVSDYIHSIGVADYDYETLLLLMDDTLITPAVNQFTFNTDHNQLFMDEQTIDFCQ